MTRINCGVKPSELSDKHLLAEHREIKRIPNLIKKGKYNMDNIPQEFKLGKGHVKFFYDKLLYLHIRYVYLYLECKKRGFNVTSFSDAFLDLPEPLYNSYVPKLEDRKLILERLKEKDKDFYSLLK